MNPDQIYLCSDALNTISQALHCDVKDIQEITVLKKGMTNHSFQFTVREQKYILRIPGEGTEHLINRKQEVEVYKAIHGLGFCDDPVYINADNGFKITRFLEDVRVCDKDSAEDLRQSMKVLRRLHGLHLQVPHTFDMFSQIGFYESLWEGDASAYPDYLKTKARVLSLKPRIDSLEKDWCLCHIDAVPDNFLFYEASEGEGLQLTDWEYAGMQDPHVDIAMFCIYSLYEKEQCDELIDLYFEGDCDEVTRAKIYAYICIGGLLWSNWCEYKRKLGVEFGEYGQKQYWYAREFCRYAEDYFHNSFNKQL